MEEIDEEDRRDASFSPGHKKIGSSCRPVNVPGIELTVWLLEGDADGTLPLFSRSPPFAGKWAFAI